MNASSEQTISQINYLIRQEGIADNVKFLRPKHGPQRYRICSAYFCQLAQQAGAMFRVGRMILIERVTFERFLENTKLKTYAGIGARHEQ